MLILDPRWTYKAGKCSAVAEGGWGGSRAQLELIDALMNFSIDS